MKPHTLFPLSEMVSIKQTWKTARLYNKNGKPIESSDVML